VPDSSRQDAQQFYESALLRIRRFMLAISGLGALLCGWFFGIPGLLGFLIGAGISYINHRWLERMVDALGERVTTGQSSERGGLLVLRAVLRYVSIAVAAYVIFRVSKAGLYGFLAGICLPIAAIACEVGVELVLGLRRET
jgi:small-conductance mechanosensitive channel